MDESLSRYVFALLFTASLITSSETSAMSAACEYEVTGTTVPPSSGNPTIIDDISGTVISANFFNGGAIDAPYFDGLETVSVCVSPFDSAGKRTAQITTDVGLDNDFIIKGYPQFVVGTKFGNLFETSFRYYNTAGLPEEDKWPVVATGIDLQGRPFEFANLEYVSDKRGVGLPAFTTQLPQITVTLDIDELNVVGSERDVMLESWFFDTSKNSAIIGTNVATNGPVANTLNNIVGVGHRHYPQLDNTLLEMMVHIGPLSPHDISNSKNNPGQNQLTEIYSGNDFDNDGIDDHFDVDSHAYSGSNDPLAPSPGIYSSGVDSNGDGIDDADILPVIIGDFAYSIWYGETFLSPVVIFSRETDSSLKNDFNPTTPDMNLSVEGEITLPWNEFLNYTMNNMEMALQSAGVAWAIGNSNPFPKMSSNSGAIGGVEFGVEPQINNQADQPYRAIVNKFDVYVNGVAHGLSDVTPPLAATTNPLDESSIAPAIADVSGTLSESQSGVDRVRVQLQRLDTSPRQYWDGNAWTTTAGFLADAAVSANGTDWTLADVDLTNPGSYRVRLRVRDNANNTHTGDFTDFTVAEPADTTEPSAAITSPADSSVISPAITTVAGIASDSDSGVDTVRVQLQRLDTSPRQYWNGSAWTTTAGFLAEAITSADGTTWTLANVDLTNPGTYRVRLRVQDNANNTYTGDFTDFTVAEPADTTEPSAAITSPADSSVISPTVTTVAGIASDSESGVDTVRVQLQRLDTSPRQYWDGNAWTTTAGFRAEAITSTDGTTWTLANVDLTNPGSYRVRLRVQDNANNTYTGGFTSFTVAAPADTTEPGTAITSPADSSVISPAITTVAGTAPDSESGADTVRVQLQRLDTSPRQYWNGSAWTTTAGFLADAVVSANGTDWTLANVDLTNPGSYRIRIRVNDNAGNIYTSDFNSFTVF